MSKSIVIGVDVGGTFTDILALDENTGEVRVAKVPSTRGDQSAGFLSGIKAATDDLSAVSTIIHGTTCLLYTSPSPRDSIASRMPSSA